MMINPFPFGFPPVRRPYPKYNTSPSNFVEHSEAFLHKVNSHNSNSSDTNINNNKINLTSNNENHEDYFEIFGLQLHFDDLLIIALLFFLYQEEVKDTYLYIALILLLLS